MFFFSAGFRFSIVVSSLWAEHCSLESFQTAMPQVQEWLSWRSSHGSAFRLLYAPTPIKGLLPSRALIASRTVAGRTAMRPCRVSDLIIGDFLRDVLGLRSPRRLAPPHAAVSRFVLSVLPFLLQSSASYDPTGHYDACQLMFTYYIVETFRGEDGD